MHTFHLTGKYFFVYSHVSLSVSLSIYTLQFLPFFFPLLLISLPSVYSICPLFLHLSYHYFLYFLFLSSHIYLLIHLTVYVHHSFYLLLTCPFNYLLLFTCLPSFPGYPFIKSSVWFIHVCLSVCLSVSPSCTSVCVSVSISERPNMESSMWFL